MPPGSETPKAARRQSADPLEVYDTPRLATVALLSACPWILDAERLIEPCAGAGAIVRVLEDHGATVTAFDLKPRVEHYPLFEDAPREPLALQADATDPWFWDRPEFSGNVCVVTNPPFSLASIMRNLARERRYRLAMFLRLSAFEPTADRAPWLRDDPPSDVVLLPRLSFTGGGNDQIACAWFAWGERGERGLTRLHVPNLQEIQA